MGTSVLLSVAGWGEMPFLPQSGLTGLSGMACSLAFLTGRQFPSYLNISNTGRPLLPGERIVG